MSPHTARQPPDPSPYVGPHAFDQGRELYGRDAHAAALIDALLAERIILYHSPSGAGKTSVIQALLIPRLREMGFHVYGPARVGAQAGAAANPYVLSVLLSMEQQHAARAAAAGADAELMPAEELSRLTLPQYLDLRGAERARNAEPEAIILDQFEEILTRNRDDIETKKEFFRQLGVALRPRHRWALVALREEYVAALDPYVHLVPTRFAERYALDLLDEHGAREAIARPVEKLAPFTDEALDYLVDSLRRAPRPGSPEGVLGRYIEPVQLQVVCTRIWERVQGAKQITRELVGQVGDVDTALAEYYAQKVREVSERTGVDERAIRRWFDEKLISNDVRVQVADGSEVAYGLTEETMAALEDVYLVRREERRTTFWRELAHDRLVRPVKRDNGRWFRAHLQGLQLYADTWAGSGRPRDALFRDARLKEAHQWARDNPQERTPEIDEFLLASDHAQKEDDRRTQRVMRGVIAVMAVLLLVAVSQLLSARAARDRAGRAEQLAKERLALYQAADSAKDAAEAVTTVVAQFGASAQGLTKEDVQRSLVADAALQRALAQRTGAPQQIIVTYYKKATDSDIEPTLEKLGFILDVKPGQLRDVATNAIAFGSGVDAESIKLVTLALLRANVPVRRICDFRDPEAKRDRIEVIAVPDAARFPVIPLDSAAAINPRYMRWRCTRGPADYSAARS